MIQIWSINAKTGKWQSGKILPRLEWTQNEDFLRSPPIFLKGDFRKYREFSPVMLFGLFLDDELTEYTVEHSTV